MVVIYDQKQAFYAFKRHGITKECVDAMDTHLSATHEQVDKLDFLILTPSLGAIESGAGPPLPHPGAFP